MNPRVHVPLLLLVWIVVGIVIAVNKNYGDHLDNASHVGTFVLAVLLWPVLATGHNLALTFS